MRASVLVLIAASALVLTGCGVAVPGKTVTVTATPSPTPTTAVPLTGPFTGSPVGTTCDDLVQPPVMQSLYPGYVIDPSHIADEGEWHAITTMGGVLCAWGGSDNKGDIVIGYAHPDAASLASIEAHFAGDGTYVKADELARSTDAVAYFGSLGGVPDAEVFVGGYWVTISSNLFSTANDAGSLLDSVNQVIPQA